MTVIDNVALIKNKRIKGTSQDPEIIEKINERDKVFKKFKNIDKDGKEAKNDLQKIICTKKKAYFVSKHTQNIGKSNELWKSFKSLGLKIERSISNVNCLENDKSAIFHVKNIDKVCSAYLSNLAENIVGKFLSLSSKCSVFSFAQYYSDILLTKKFDLPPTEKNFVFKILRDINNSKADDVKRIPGRFLKDAQCFS